MQIISAGKYACVPRLRVRQILKSLLNTSTRLRKNVRANLSNSSSDLNGKMDMLLARGHIEFVPLATLVEAILRYKALSGVEANKK
jgi:hypothetical protein